MEFIHHEWLMRNFTPRGWHVGADGVVVLEERKFNLLTGRNEVAVTLIHPDGTRKKYHHAMRIYSAAEPARMLRKAGLAVTAAYGRLDGRELTLDTNRLALLARK